ncbi:hypothetical protein BC831DRAFT_546379 [Entophlyctis helioformis]|nr:hypothetical protein BC831DRAFT_546379 [Entophlyctis helioformis]
MLTQILDHARCSGLSLSGIRISPDVLASSLASPHLQSLHLANTSLDTRILRSAVIPQCTRLSRIALDGVPGIDDLVVMAIAHSCPALTSVAFASCPMVTDLGIKAIAESCPLLTHVDMSGTNITVAAVFAISDRRGSQIVHLSIAGCPLRKADANMLAAALVDLTGLVSLNVSCMSAGWTALSAASVPQTPIVLSLAQDSFEPDTSDASSASAWLATQFPHLETLHVGFMECPDEMDCRRLFGRLHGLRSLWFPDSFSLTPRSLRCILDRCRNLTHLHLPSLSPALSPLLSTLPPSALLQIPSKCTRLRMLSLVGHTVSADVLRSIALGCLHLVELDISLTRRVDPPITRDVLFEFVAGAPRLEVLRMAGRGFDAKFVRPLQRVYPHVHFDLFLQS